MKMGRVKSFLLALVSLALLLALIIFLYNYMEPTPIESHTEFAYVPNVNSHNISVINTTNDYIEYSLYVGNDTEGVAVDPNGTKVYVTSGIHNTVYVIDTAKNEIIANLSVGKNPLGIAVAPDGKKVYVANWGSNDVSIINTATNTVEPVEVQSNPLGVAVAPNGAKVYVTNYNSGTVSEIDTVTNDVVPVKVDYNPSGVAVNQNGTKVYVTHDNRNSVYVIDTTTHNATPIAGKNIGNTTQNVALSPSGVVVNPNGTKVYVANRRTAIKSTSRSRPLPGSVSVIDTATNSVIETVDLKGEKCPTGISINSNGTKLYVCNACSNTVSVIDTDTNSVTKTVKVGLKPEAVGQFIASPPKVPEHKPVLGYIDHFINIIQQNEIYKRINLTVNGVQGFIIGMLFDIIRSHIKDIFEKTLKPILDIFEKTLEPIYMKISEFIFRKKYKK